LRGRKEEFGKVEKEVFSGIDSLCFVDWRKGSSSSKGILELE
jgi:hypothetical protein